VVTKVLVVEDEAALRDPLVYGLKREGFEVSEASDGRTALDSFAADPADIVLLDLMLPVVSGTEVCKQIRATSRVPIIMISAKDSEIDKVVGLELGADDYVTKPYSFRELLARINAVLRRVPEAPPKPAPTDDSGLNLVKVNQLVLDLEAHTLKVAGNIVALPPKEFDLLEMFMHHVGKVLTRYQLIDGVWGRSNLADTKTLDVHVKRLRSKIELDPSKPLYLQTIRGIGYKLVDPSR
jgi:two-component system response regulator RegX3